MSDEMDRLDMLDGCIHGGSFASMLIVDWLGLGRSCVLASVGKNKGRAKILISIWLFGNGETISPLLFRSWGSMDSNSSAVTYRLLPSSITFLPSFLPWWSLSYSHSPYSLLKSHPTTPSRHQHHIPNHHPPPTSNASSKTFNPYRPICKIQNYTPHLGRIRYPWYPWYPPPMWNEKVERREMRMMIMGWLPQRMSREGN